MTTQRKNFVFGTGLLLFFVYAITLGLIQRKKLKTSNTFGICKIMKYSVGGRGAAGTIWLEYIYTVNGRQFKGSKSYSTSQLNWAMIKPKLYKINLPIIYSKKDPSVSTMLLFENDFERWGYIQPDSLKELTSIISAK
jgi:hypothetical protein